MTKKVFSRTGLLAGLVALALVLAGVAVSNALDSQSTYTPLTPGQAEAKVKDPSYDLKAQGLATATPTHVFTLANGSDVSVVSNATGRCVMPEYGEARCGDPVEIAAGQTIEVLDECGAKERNRMEITGLAPESATEALLVSSDGTSVTSSIVDGAFKFDAANPTSGGPYPTHVEWRDRSGASAGSAKLPVRGDDFCIQP
jgi:hypothetical protein